MFEPFVMIAMCDCVVDPKTKKKVCTPFLRAWTNDCKGIHVIGDFDHRGEKYEPKGTVSSEAKCCDCCGDEQKVEVCYDLRCLIRREERNGGLENINILGGDGALGGIVNFSPPANDTESIAKVLNEMGYLGFTSWNTSPEKAGFLCVSVDKGQVIPKEATGCRFRRFRVNAVNGGMSMTVSHPNYGTYTTTFDSVSPGAPGVTDQLITQSNTHFYCKLSLDRSTGFGTSGSTAIEVAVPFASGVLQRANVFRCEFPDNSTAMYVPNYPTNTVWTDIWPTGGVNTAANRAAWAFALGNWMQFIVGQGLTYGSAICYTAWSATEDPANTNVAVDRYNGQVVLDVPCNIKLNLLYGIQMNPLEISTGNVLSGGMNGHRRFFDEVTGVGGYVSTPYVDGVGGSTSWASDCSIASPLAAASASGTSSAMRIKRK